MKKIAQLRVTLKGDEIDAAIAALETVADGATPDMARPYREIVADIQKVRNYGDKKSATITVTGGYVDCLTLALERAEGLDEVAARARKNVRGMTDDSVPRDGT